MSLILEQISHTEIAIPYTINQSQSRNCHFCMQKLYIYVLKNRAPVS